MVTEMIQEYVYASNNAERKKAERKCRKHGISKKELEVMAWEYLEDLGYGLEVIRNEENQ